MRRYLGSECARLGVLFLLLAAGCAPVREDRTITWSGQGDSVGFQHGQEGVFVADREGGGLRKIFQPGADVLAVSPPLWAPSGGRLIFTTARSTQPGNALPPQFRGDPDPAGRLFVQQPVFYSCWLREEARDGKAPEPVALFEAACDHVGYVAANLAVRWHPHGDRILYVKQVSDGRHGVFAFDLATETSIQVFPRTSAALTFEWAPDGKHLVCVLGSPQRDPANDGIWIGRPGAADWWHVPDSAALAEGQLSSLLEQLRATQPAWTPDGTRFAFVSCTAPQDQKRPLRHFLCVGTLANHEVRVAAVAGETFRDLHWAPDGQRLGVVQGGETGSLRLLPEGGELSEPVNRRPVRHFAGWQRDGESLAYVVPDRVPLADGPMWALLLLPDPLARDAVLLADGKGTEPGQEVFSGMRVTFPHWSPKEDKLSLWATFSPTYRSWLSQLLQGLNLGVRRGDPAAVFDTTTGRLGWMATDGQEKAQVGHYYLLKHEYAEAWRWYEQAERDQPPAPAERPPLDLANLGAVLESHDYSFFEYLCLTKLGRHEEAAAKLARFRNTYLRISDQQLEPLSGVKIDNRSLEQWLRDALAPETLTGALLRDLYMAEAFLAVDAVADGERFFHRAVDTAPNDSARLSSALVLAEFLLLQQKFAAYTELATGTVAPLLLRMQGSLATPNSGVLLTPQEIVLGVTVGVGGLVLLPLGSAEFMAGLPEERARALLPRWQKLANDARDDFSRLEVDLVLDATYQRLGMEVERRAVTQRLEKERQVAGDYLPMGQRAADLVERFRQARSLYTR
jgi:tetratricopeptide (TPR) repeat protein